MDVATWLRDLGLERYAPAFLDAEVTAEALPELTDADLRELGLPLGPRKVLLKAIQALADLPPPSVGIKEEAAPWRAPTGSSLAERRQLTVMFVDLVGSTALSQRLDPEEMGEVIQAYQATVAAEITRFDGHVAKFMGDGILGYFGWPRAHEDEPERAVRAGLAATAAVARLTTPGGEPLAARVGVATGLVVVGNLIGEGAAQEEAVVGETPNLAARLQGLAEPGSVVVAESTGRLLGGLFALRDLGASALKGFAAPVQAFAVADEAAAEGRFEARHAAGSLTPLVGREQELTLLLDRWERAKEGEGQVVLLSGEAGIGKSRLVSALRERLGGEPHTPLAQFCSPYHANTALHPMIGLLERAAELRREDPPERQLDKLEAMLALAGRDVRDGAALLADLLGIPTAGRYPPLELSPQQRKERTFQVLLGQLAGLAAQGPLLALYEDVHWADPTTLELLGRVVERAQHLPVLALVTFRPGFFPPWAGHGHVTALSLGRLGRRQGGAMIEGVTAGKALPAEVLDQILARTDGVPLFVEELTKAVLESGLLADRGDRFELVGPLPAMAIPSSLQDSLMARLDRLAPIKEVAQIAACIGREFSHELIAAVATLPAPKLDRALAELTAAELVFPRGTPPDATYSFKHALVQDAAYQSLLKSRRQQLHARIGTVLEEQFPEVVAAQPEVLARHCAEAGLPGKAIAYAHRAARQAIERSAMVEAIAHLHQGLRLLDGLPDGVARRRQELELQTTLGVPLIAVRGMAAPEVEHAYVRARDLCLEVGDAPQLPTVLFGLWWFYNVRAELRAALEVAGQLLDMAQRGNSTADLIQAHRAMGHTLLWLGEFAPALVHFELAIALYDPEQHRSLAFTAGQEPGVLARGFASHVLWYLGYPDRALATMCDALAQAREVAHPFSLAFALDHTTWLRQYRREGVETLEGAEEDVRFSGEQGFPFFLAHGTMLRGWALAERGQEAEGIAQLHQGLAAHEATGALIIRPYGLSLLARAYGRNGRAEDAVRLLDEASSMTHDQHIWEAELHRLRGELLLVHPDGGDQPEAEVCFRRALDIARAQQARSLTEGFETSDLREARALLEE